MARVILHIGRHKTGTSAIQHFLSANPQWLRERGFYLPQTGFERVAHHRLAYPVSRRLPALASTLRTPHIFTLLRRELDDNEALTAIITSEVFQGSKPGLIKKFLGKYDPNIVVYIRNQLEYLASSYCQRVHATDYTESIEHYYRKEHRVNYTRFLQRWARHFPSSLTVRKFEHKLLFENDIVSDFLKYGLPIKEPSMQMATRTGERNPSLNAHVLFFKLHLNQTGLSAQFPPDKLYPALVRLNTLFEADKFRLPEKLSAEVVRKASLSDQAAAKRFFGEERLFDYSSYQTAEAITLDETAINTMTEALRREIEPGQR